MSLKIPRPLVFAAAVGFACGLASGPTPARGQSPVPLPTPPAKPVHPPAAPTAAPSADDLKRRAAAEELLNVRKTADLVNSTVVRMTDMTDKISDNAAKQAGPSVNPQEFGQKMRNEAREMIRKDFNWEALKPEFVQAYSEAFTEAELKELTAFYQTPTGKKLIASEPEISGKLSKLSQEKAMSIMPRVVQHLREMVAATKPASTPGGNPLTPPLPPGLTVPPPPPPGLMIPPPPPPGSVPNAPPPAAPNSTLPSPPVTSPAVP